MNVVEERVRERAYYIWESEGRVHGRAEAHWLAAEAEFRPTGRIEAAAILAVPAPAHARAASKASPKAVVKHSAKSDAAKTPVQTLKPRSKVAKADSATVAAPTTLPKEALKPRGRAPRRAPEGLTVLH